VQRSSELVHPIVEIAVMGTEPFVDISIECLEVGDAIFQLAKASLIIINDCSLPCYQLFKLSNS
jgi:hypothetical protein